MIYPTEYVHYHINKKIDVLKTFWSLYENEPSILREMFKVWGCSISPCHALNHTKEFRRILNELKEVGNE